MAKDKEKKCYYGCGEPLGNEHFSIIEGGKIVRAHKRCYTKAKAGVITFRMVIR